MDRPKLAWIRLGKGVKSPPQVLISWCPLCFSAVVFERTVDGRELTFGVSGML